jgi:Ion channel
MLPAAGEQGEGAMRIIGAVAGLVLIGLMLLEGFETLLQPRRVTHRFRLIRLFYRSTWRVWRAVATALRPGPRREAFLSVFAPLSLLGLFGTWLVGLIVGFALLHWAMQSPLHQEEQPGFITYLYLSGTTCFTLGYGDITPAATLGRMLAVMEAGLGFGFLAILITYLPVLFQAFSHREVMIAVMDARAGSPPSAGVMLLRLARAGKLASVERMLQEWEVWAAELLESHLSFPVLSYYRSQHDNQSWLAMLATILDTCALLIVKVKPADSHQAQLTFAMARHAAVDLGLVLKVPARMPESDRLPDQERQRMEKMLQAAGLELRQGREADETLAELRGMYEPFLGALAQYLLFTVPPIMPAQENADNWQRSAWMQQTPGIGSLPQVKQDGEHFG